MRKMNLIDGDEELEGYEFIGLAVWSENIDGQMDIYTVAICKDPHGYLHKHAIENVRFV